MRYPRLFDRDAAAPTSMEETLQQARQRGMVVREGGSTAGSCRPRRLDALLSADACKLFFLTRDDLHGIPCREVLAGPYSRSGNNVWQIGALRDAALRKHGGESGFQKKLDQRVKREVSKRQREEAAAQAAADLAAKRQCPDLIASGAGANNDKENLPTTAGGGPGRTAPAPPADVKQLRSVAKQLVQGRLLTWDFLRQKQAPNGTVGTVQLEDVSQEQFAALSGRPDDPGLTTLVKKGAWFTATGLSCAQVFGEASVRGRGGKYGGNCDLGVMEHIELKYAPKMRRMSVKCDVRHIG